MVRARSGRLAAVAVAVLLGLSACGTEYSTPADRPGPRQANEVTIGVAGDEGTLTPYTHQTGYPGRNLVALVYDTLLDRDQHNELKPLLATGVEANQDNTAFTVPLRTDVRWHDGKPFTAADVVFSVDYHRQHPEGDSVPAIANVTAVTPRADTVDTVVFTLAAADPDFPSRLLADLRILPEHVWSTIDAPETATVEQAVGTGPYRLTKYTKDQGYELSANAEYPIGRPKIKTIKIAIIPEQQTGIAALRTTEVSVLSGQLPAEQAAGLRRQPGVRIAHGSSFTSTLLAFNNGRAPFDDPTVRAAISAAIDQQSLIDTVLRGGGQPGSPGFWHPDAAGADTALRHDYDPKHAAELLDKAGATPGQDGIRVLAGKPMSYPLLVQSENPRRVRAAELIRDMLSEVGIAVKVSAMDSDSVDAKVWPELDVGKGRDYDLAMWGWSAPVMLDPTSMSDILDADTSVGRLNITGTNDADIDGAAGRLRDATTTDDRRAALRDLQGLVEAKVPFVTLYYPEDSFGYRSDVYDGWVYQEGQGLLAKQSFVDLRW